MAADKGSFKAPLPGTLEKKNMFFCPRCPAVFDGVLMPFKTAAVKRSGAHRL